MEIEKKNRREFIKYLIGISSIVGSGLLLINSEKNQKLLEISKTSMDEKKITEDFFTDGEGNYHIYRDYTGKFEGRSLSVYDAKPFNHKIFERTIGIGHNLDREDSRSTFIELFGNDFDYDSIYFGKSNLSDEQVDILFTHDIKEHEKLAEKLIHGFDKLPDYLRQALVDMSFRGDLGDSPKTRELINKGKWDEGAEEYINRREYRTAISENMRGLIMRMNSNRNRMKLYSREFN